jgi:hypothetical protein
MVIARRALNGTGAAGRSLQRFDPSALHMSRKYCPACLNKWYSNFKQPYPAYQAQADARPQKLHERCERALRSLQ